MMWRREIKMEKAYPVEDNFTKDTLRAGAISLFGEEAGSHMKSWRDKKYFMDVIHANLFERNMSMNTFILELFKLSGIQHEIPTEVVLANDEPRFVSKEVIYGFVDVIDAKVDAEPVLEVETKLNEMKIQAIVEEDFSNDDKLDENIDADIARCEGQDEFMMNSLSNRINVFKKYHDGCLKK